MFSVFLSYLSCCCLYQSVSTQAPQRPPMISEAKCSVSRVYANLKIGLRDSEIRKLQVVSTDSRNIKPSESHGIASSLTGMFRYTF